MRRMIAKGDSLKAGSKRFVLVEYDKREGVQIAFSNIAVNDLCRLTCKSKSRLGSEALGYMGQITVREFEDYGDSRNNKRSDDRFNKRGQSKDTLLSYD